MQVRPYALMMACAVLPAALAAQGTTAMAAPAASTSPVADALRQMEQRSARNLIAAAEAMPAEKYGYRPTPAQMSFAAIQVHLANEGNDFLCGKVGGVASPQRPAVDTTMTKEQLVARLKETFTFCEQAFAHLDDSKLSEQMTFFGTNTVSRATAILITVGDWADHYSQEANYLRLNGLVPPTAQRRGM
ncbi:MAG TPA: DinB family protein [Gemmatimonadales bacterium]